MAVGSGEPGGDEYHTFVLYHNNSPRWAELIKLPIPVDMFRGSHVRFEFRHCSSKSDTAEKRHCSFCSSVYDAFNIHIIHKARRYFPHLMQSLREEVKLAEFQMNNESAGELH